VSQNDFVIANQTAPNFRADLNLALQALASTSSGATAPSTTYANMLWYDSGTNILKMRSEADDAWINLGTLDQSLNTFVPAGVAELTQVQVEDDTSTVFGQVSGQRLGQAVAARVGTTAGAVGTYAFANSPTSADTAFGDSRAGSDLQTSSAMYKFSTDGGADIETLTSGSPLTGTWRCMGNYDYQVGPGFGGAYANGATLWLRIA